MRLRRCLRSATTLIVRISLFALSTLRAMAPLQSRLSAASLTASYSDSPIGTNGKMVNSSNWIPWTSRTCMAILAHHHLTPSFFVNIGTIRSNLMALARPGTAVMAPLVLPPDSSWLIPTPPVSSNPACDFSSPFVPTRVSLLSRSMPPMHTPTLLRPISLPSSTSTINMPIGMKSVMV